MIDLAVVAPDPRFGGGGRYQTEAFWNASTALGRRPHLLSLGYRALADRDAGSVLNGDRFVELVRGADGINQLIAARRIAPRLAAARAVWVVAPVASHGYAAARSGRVYAAWIGTSLRDEWSGRRHALGRARRTAYRLSARTLLRIERETLRGASRVYATSPSSRAAAARAGDLDPANISILPIPIDVEHFRPAPDAEWHAGLERPTIAFVGRADDPRKNVSLLLDAFAGVRRAVPAATLLLVGEPPAQPLPPGATATGEVDDVAVLLRRAAIFVLPSLQEGFGIAAAEALAAGVPVVTTPSGGPEDLVRESGGGVVLEGFAVDELETALLKLLGDGERLALMRAAGREHVVREHSRAQFERLLMAAFDALAAL
jgi:glycosyltransferase involved in cell wall biosynthesis